MASAGSDHDQRRNGRCLSDTRRPRPSEQESKRCGSRRIRTDSSRAAVHALGVVDFGMFFGQNISLQSAAREGARQGVTQGDVIKYTNQARGLLDHTKLQIKFVVDTSAGAPGTMVVCVRYPQSSLTGFFSFALNGASEAKSVMRMEGTAPAAPEKRIGVAEHAQPKTRTFAHCGTTRKN